MARRDVPFAFRVMVQRLEGVAPNSGPYCLKYRRGDKRRGEVPPKSANGSGHVIFDSTFEVDGTLQSRGGNKYHAKTLAFTLEEMRDGRPHRCGEAKLNLADCLPFGHAVIRHLAFGPCTGIVGLVGRPADEPSSNQVEIPDVDKLTEQLHTAEDQLRAAEKERASLQQQLAAQKAEGQRQEDKLVELHGCMENLRGNAEVATGQAFQLELQLRSKVEECGTLQQQVATLQSVVLQTQHQAQQYEAQLQKSEHEVETLQQRVEELEAHAEEQCNRIEELEVEVSDLEKERRISAELQAKVVAEAEHIHDLEQQLADALRQVQELGEELEDNQQRILQLEEAMSVKDALISRMEEQTRNMPTIASGSFAGLDLNGAQAADTEGYLSLTQNGQALDQGFLTRIFALEREVQNKTERCRRVEEGLVLLQQEVTVGAPRDVYLQCIRQLKAELRGMPLTDPMEGSMEEAVAKHLQRIGELEAMLEEKEEQKRRIEEQSAAHVGDLQLRLQETERALRLQREEAQTLQQKFETTDTIPSGETRSPTTLDQLQHKLQEKEAEVAQLVAQLTETSQQPGMHLNKELRAELREVQRQLHLLSPQAQRWQDLEERVHQKSEDYMSLQGRVTALKKSLFEDDDEGDLSSFSEDMAVIHERLQRGTAQRDRLVCQLLDVLHEARNGTFSVENMRRLVEDLEKVLMASDVHVKLLLSMPPSQPAAPVPPTTEDTDTLQNAAARIVELQLQLAAKEEELRTCQAPQQPCPRTMFEIEEERERSALQAAAADEQVHLVEWALRDLQEICDTVQREEPLDDVEELQRELEEQREQTTEMKEQLCLREAEVEALMKERDQLAARVAQAPVEARRTSLALQQLQDTLQDREEELASAQAELRKSQQALHDAERGAERASAEFLEQLQQEVDEGQALMSDLGRQISMLQGEIKRKSEETRAADRRYSQASEQVIALEDRLRETEGALKDAEAELHRLRLQVAQHVRSEGSTGQLLADREAEVADLRKKLAHCIWGASLPSVPSPQFELSPPENIPQDTPVKVGHGSTNDEVVIQLHQRISELQNAVRLAEERCAAEEAVQEEQATQLEEVETLLRRNRERLREAELRVEQLEEQLNVHSNGEIDVAEKMLELQEVIERGKQREKKLEAEVERLRSTADLPSQRSEMVDIATEALGVSLVDVEVQAGDHIEVPQLRFRDSALEASPVASPLASPRSRRSSVTASMAETRWREDAMILELSQVPGLLSSLAKGTANVKPRTAGCVTAAVLLEGHGGSPTTWPLAGNALLLNVVVALQQSATSAPNAHPDETMRWLSMVLHFLNVLLGTGPVGDILYPVFSAKPPPPRNGPEGAEGLHFVTHKLLPLVQAAYNRTIGAAIKRFTRALDGTLIAPIAAAVAAGESPKVQWEELHDILAELTDDLERSEAPAVLWHTAALHLCQATDSALLTLLLHGAPVLSCPQGGIELKMAVGKAEAMLNNDGPHRVARCAPPNSLPSSADRLMSHLQHCRQACDVLMLPKFDLLHPELRASVCSALTDHQLLALVEPYKSDDAGEAVEDVLERLRPMLDLQESKPVEPPILIPYWPKWATPKQLPHTTSTSSMPATPMSVNADLLYNEDRGTPIPKAVTTEAHNTDVSQLQHALAAAEERLQASQAVQAEQAAQIEELENVLRRSRERLRETELRVEELQAQLSHANVGDESDQVTRLRAALVTAEVSAATQDSHPPSHPPRSSKDGIPERGLAQYAHEVGLFNGLVLGHCQLGPKACGVVLGAALLEWHTFSPPQWGIQGNTASRNLTSALHHAFADALRGTPDDLLGWLSKVVHMLDVMVSAVPDARVARWLIPDYRPCQGPTEPPTPTTVPHCPIPFGPPDTPVLDCSLPSNEVIPAAVVKMFRSLLPLVEAAYSRTIGLAIRRFARALEPRVVAPIALSAPELGQAELQLEPLHDILAELTDDLQRCETPALLWHTAAIHLCRATDASLVTLALKAAGSLSSNHGGIQLKMAISKLEGLLSTDGPHRVARSLPSRALLPTMEKLSSQLRCCRQVCDVLMLPKADLIEAELRASVCPDLNVRQVYHLLKEYKAEESVDPTAEVLIKLASLCDSKEDGPIGRPTPVPCWTPPPPAPVTFETGVDLMADAVCEGEPPESEPIPSNGGAVSPEQWPVDLGTDPLPLDMTAARRHISECYADVKQPLLVPPLPPLKLLSSSDPTTSVITR